MAGTIVQHGASSTALQLTTEVNSCTTTTDNDSSFGASRNRYNGEDLHGVELSVPLFDSATEQDAEQLTRLHTPVRDTAALSSSFPRLKDDGFAFMYSNTLSSILHKIIDESPSSYAHFGDYLSKVRVALTHAKADEVASINDLMAKMVAEELVDGVNGVEITCQWDSPDTKLLLLDTRETVYIRVHFDSNETLHRGSKFFDISAGTNHHNQRVAGAYQLWAPVTDSNGYPLVILAPKSLAPKDIIMVQQTMLDSRPTYYIHINRPQQNWFWRSRMSAGDFAVMRSGTVHTIIKNPDENGNCEHRIVMQLNIECAEHALGAKTFQPHSNLRDVKGRQSGKHAMNAKKSRRKNLVGSNEQACGLLGEGRCGSQSEFEEGNCQYREELMRKRNHYTKAGVGGDYAVGGTYALSDSKEGGRRVKRVEDEWGSPGVKASCEGSVESNCPRISKKWKLGIPGSNLSGREIVTSTDRSRAIKRSRSWTNRDFLERETGHGYRKRRRRENIPPLIVEERGNENSHDEKFAVMDYDYKAENYGEVEVVANSQEQGDKDEEKINDGKGNAATGEKEMADKTFLSIFECPVCKQLLHNPVTLKCGHSLCEDCMMQYLENGTGRCKCPADLLADASAICSVLPQGTEGRQLEIVRREIRLMRLQNQQALREQVRASRGRGGGGGSNGAAAARRGARRDGLNPSSPFFQYTLPLTAKWMVIMMVFTVWSLVDTNAVSYLKLDWNKVSEGEFWRLGTTFFSLGNRSNLLRSVFSLLRLYFLKPYEPTIGTKRYGKILVSGVIIMLMWSYMNQATAVKQQQQQQQQQDHELDDSDFLSHWLIWHMFVYYCLEKPLLFLVLLWLVQLEAIVQAPWQNLTMFLMMLSPRIPYIAITLYKNLNNYMFNEEQRHEELFHIRTRVVLRG
eukprot:jgi/Bigna1/91146/estExt_fgenesh1_pg.C_900008